MFLSKYSQLGEFRVWGRLGLVVLDKGQLALGHLKKESFNFQQLKLIIQAFTEYMYRIWQELTFCLDDVILWHQFGWSWGHEQFLEGCLREVLLTEHDNLYRHDYRDRMVVFFSEGDHPGDHRMVRFLHSSLHILCFDICIDKKTSKWQDSTLCFFGGPFFVKWFHVLNLHSF